MSVLRAVDHRSWFYRHWRKVLGWPAMLVALVAVGTLALNEWMMTMEAGRIYPTSGVGSSRAVGLVLGTDPGSLEMAERLDTAALLYQEGKVQHWIVSGGSEPPDYDEARDMWAGLRARGVPAAAITQDPMGYRTLDSMARAREVFGVDGLVIVTQKFHLYRAVFLARHWGLDAVGCAAPDAEPFISRSHVREWMARVLAVLDVTVLNRQPKVGGPPAPIVLPPADVSKT